MAVFFSRTRGVSGKFPVFDLNLLGVKRTVEVSDFALLSLDRSLPERNLVVLVPAVEVGDQRDRPEDGDGTDGEDGDCQRVWCTRRLRT